MVPQPTHGGTRIAIPLLTRASDRSISQCPWRWHAEQQGIVDTGASWFAIGTAAHSAFERALIQRPKRLSTVQKWAAVELERELADMPHDFLASKYRPIDGASEYELMDALVAQWWQDVTVDQPDWLPLPPIGEEATCELNVRVSPDDPKWQWEGGASTTIDYIYHGPGRTVLVDWKTGRSRKSDPLQLQFYRYLLEEYLGYTFDDSQVWGAFYHAEHGKWQIVDEYDPQAVEEMIGSSQRLKKLKRPEPQPSWLCDYCPAQSICPSFVEDEADAAVMQDIVEHNITKYEFVVDPNA